MRVLFITLLAALAGFTLATDACAGVSAGTLYSPADALACLRSLPIPDSYSKLCTALPAVAETYAFIDALETAGAFPETRAPGFVHSLKAACERGLATGNTFDFHNELATHTLTTLKDPHSGWIPTPAYSGVFRFLAPVTLAIDEDENGEVIFTMEKAAVIDEHPEYGNFYEKVHGFHTYSMISKDVGKPITEINGMPPAEFISKIAEEHGTARTPGQRFALAASTFGEASLTRNLSPKNWALPLLGAPDLELNPNAIFVTVRGGTTSQIGFIAVAKRDLEKGSTTLAELEFPADKAATAAAAGQFPAPDAVPARPRHLAFTLEEALGEARVQAQVQNAASSAAAEDGEAAVLTTGTYVRSFLHAATHTTILQITTYAPNEAKPGAGEHRWLEEFDEALRVIRSRNLDDPAQGNRLVIDLRLNGGGWIELGTVAVDILSGGAGTPRASCAGGIARSNTLYPRVFGRAYLRAGRAPEHDVSEGRDPAGLDAPERRLPNHIYDLKLPMYKSWSGNDIHTDVLSGHHQGPRKVFGYLRPETAHTRDFFYPNLSVRAANHAKITGEYPERYVRGEFPEYAWPKLIEVASTEYRLRNTLDNTVVLVGPMTASCGAFTAHNLMQGSHAKLAASTGDPRLPLGGQMQAGLVPGGDTVTLTDLIFPFYPKWARAITGAAGWPTRGEWHHTNFAVAPVAPDAAARHGDSTREFQAEPVHAVFYHSNPIGGLATDPAHIWGTTEDAAAAATKLARTGVWTHCGANTFEYDQAATARANDGTIRGRRCNPETGSYSDDEGVMGCDWGFEYNYATHTCHKVACPAGQTLDTVLGTCILAPHKTLSVPEIVGIILAVVIAAAAAAAAIAIACRKRKNNYTAVEAEASSVEENI